MRISKITKAVFPVAGFGTRFLPATKAIPKEMLPIVDKPVIQYAVEEAIAAGIKEIIFVTSSNKSAIENHFDTNFELEYNLKTKKKYDLLASIQNILPTSVSYVAIRQHEQLGLGHAVLCARDIVGNEPFAVILPDDLIKNEKPALKQMVESYNELGGSIIAVEEVPYDMVEKYGIVDFGDNAKLPTDAIRLQGIVEKPKKEKAPSNFAVVGRYILTPHVFDLLQNIGVGVGAEIQLTDAIAKLIREEEVYGFKFMGTRYDCGSKEGFLEATVDHALCHSELKDDFIKFLKLKFRL